MGEELKKIIDDPNLSNEEIAKRVRETLNKNSEQVVEDKSKEEPISELEKALSPEELNYLISVLDVRQGDVQTNNIIKKLQDKGVNFTMDELVSLLDKKKEERMSNKEEFFNELEKRISKEDMEYLLSVDLDNPGSKISYIAARAGVTNYEVIELAKYRKAQMKEYERLSIYDKALSEQDLKYLMEAKDVNQADYEINNILVRLRKQGIDANLKDLASFIEYKKGGIDFSKFDPNKEQKEKENTNEKDVKKDKPISKEDLYKEYLEIDKRINEIESIMREALETKKKVSDELVAERNRLLDRKRELVPQIKDMLNINDKKKKPRDLSDYVEEQKQEKEKKEEQKADDNEIVSERDGSFLSKAKGFIDKVKNLSTKGKIIGLAGLAAAGVITAGVYMAMKHGDVQTLNDALHQAGMHIQDAANQLNPDPSGIDPSTIGQHIDTTFVSSGDAANYAHALKPIEEYFQYDIQNLVDSHNNIIPAHGMSYDELIELIKNGNDIASVQVGGDAAHIDGHLNINDILNAYDATVKSGGAVR